ncbi:undecaprenyl-diphosphatase [Peribacillus deserti]|uniref:Undecaprenyl-diphosphatase n=1 Tax=Peribacillus deserti TaxID=673318 RepID=A0ABS2QM09_9BACI|nr:undecaprenyl-diphosphatase [Peribacillus deserti]
MHEIIIAFILGIVEGLTEFAPVSSTGHLILTGHLLGFEESRRSSTFEVFIQLGSILAVVVVFWNRLRGLFGLGPERVNSKSGSGLNLIHVLLGILPFMVLGLLFHGYIKDVLFSGRTVVIGLIAGAVLMIAAELLGRNQKTSLDLDQISYKQALVMGLVQCLALWPGFSRSGSTISAGLLSGLNHKTASEFSFMLAVPIMVAATGKDIWENINYLSVSDIPMFLTGFVTAFLVALFAIRFFLRLISRVKLIPFALYRLALAFVFWMFLL